MWSSKITFRKNRQGFHPKYNNDFSSKFGDGDRPNLCRLKKVDVSSTFIEIYFGLGWPSSVLEIVSVTKIKNNRLVQSELGTLELWISRSMLDVDLLLICRLTGDLYSIFCMVIILIITRQKFILLIIFQILIMQLCIFIVYCLMIRVLMVQDKRWLFYSSLRRGGEYFCPPLEFF